MGTYGARAITRWFFGLGTLIVACGGKHKPPPVPAGPEVAAVHIVRPEGEGVKALDRREGVGLSGLTLDDAGDLWAVSEEGTFIARIRPEGTAWFPIVGMPKGLEPESLAYYGPGVFLMGTESDDSDRGVDLVLRAVFDGMTLTVEDAPFKITYSSHPALDPHVNRGIEGLCVVDGLVIAAVEVDMGSGRERVAPIVRFDKDMVQPSWFHVGLTSRDGRISAMHCEPTSRGVRVFAVERHFDPRRVISFEIPHDAFGSSVPLATLSPAIERDFALPGGLDSEYNPEGIVVTPAATFIVNDNSYRGRQGDTMLTRWPTFSRLGSDKRRRR